jgi:PAS domain S-box-containing protein
MRRAGSNAGAASILEEVLLSTVFAQAPDGIVVADRDGRCVAVNPRFCEIVGRPREAVLSMALTELVVPAEANRLSAARRRLLLRAGGIDGGEWRVRSGRGDELTVEVTARTLADGGCLAFVRDVSARRSAEHARERSAHEGEAERAWLRTVLETVPLGVILFEPDGRLVFNRRAEELLGLELSPMAGSAQYLDRIRRPDGTPIEPDQLVPSRVMQGETLLGIELLIERPDGSRVPILGSAAPIRDVAGRIVGGVGVFQDVGEQLRIHESIRANEQLLAGIFELLPVGIQIADRAGHIVRANPASSRIWRGSDSVGPELERVRTWWADTGEPVVDGEGSLARALTEGMTSVGELLRIQCFDGTFKTIINAALPLRDQRGRLAGALVVDEDVTGLHETEAALRSAVKSRDEVLRVVSHDLRDPLQCIALTAQQIGEQIESGLVPEALRPAVDRLLRSSRSMTRLVDDLLDVASIEAGRLGLRPTALPADVLVRESLDAHEAHAQARGIALTIATETSSTIVADQGRLQQALSNIVGNALKFTPAGGTVAVRADDDADAVRISVVDSGPGIEREHVARVFEPFWQSSHADRRGRGLGLAIAKGIVEAHGGRIWLESELGCGTAVRFTVPKAASA